MLTSKLEVLVELGEKPDHKVLERTLNELKAQDGVKEAIFKEGAFMVETTLPSQNILDLVSKSSGKRAVLQGFGDTQSAVAIISSQTCCGRGRAVGVVRFQESGGALVAEGSAAGLPPGARGLHLHSAGDLSQGCQSIGPHYNPANASHGGPGDPPHRRHAGDLGNIIVDDDGNTSFRIVNDGLKISEIIGRSIAISEREDDFGRGSTPDSKIDGNSGIPIACGVIARSAGIFQNPKRVCACDGVVVWDERDRPAAGKGRRDKKPCCAQDHGNIPCCKV